MRVKLDFYFLFFFVLLLFGLLSQSGARDTRTTRFDFLSCYRFTFGPEQDLTRSSDLNHGFCYHLYDYRPNWTPLSAITITCHYGAL